MKEGRNKMFDWKKALDEIWDKVQGITRLETHYSFGLPAGFNERLCSLPVGYHHITLTYRDNWGEVRESEMFGENRNFFLSYLDHLTHLHCPGNIKIKVTTPYTREEQVAIFEEDLKRYANMRGDP